MFVQRPNRNPLPDPPKKNTVQLELYPSFVWKLKGEGQIFFGLLRIEITPEDPKKCATDAHCNCNCSVHSCCLLGGFILILITPQDFGHNQCAVSLRHQCVTLCGGLHKAWPLLSQRGDLYARKKARAPSEHLEMLNEICAADNSRFSFLANEPSCTLRGLLSNMITIARKQAGLRPGEGPCLAGTAWTAARGSSWRTKTWRGPPGHEPHAGI